jgi:ketosteroid isomerase-like protein
MSRENVEVVQRYFGALIRRLASYWEDPRSISQALKTGDLDRDSREALALTHPDQRWKNALGVVYQGHAECAKGVDELLEASQHYAMSLQEVTDLGGDRVLAALGVSLKGKSSGAVGDISIFSVLTVRDGLIVEADEYLSHTEALKAVGLEE